MTWLFAFTGTIFGLMIVACYLYDRTKEVRPDRMGLKPDPVTQGWLKCHECKYKEECL